MTYPFDCITDLIFMKKEELDPSDVIFVPGGSHVAPMQIASELYHRGLAPYILPSGGYNSKIGRTEWEHLRDIALSCGVPESAILKEDQAKNTFDNARLSQAVLTASRITVNRAILVCKSFHARRALMTYQTVFPLQTRIFVEQDDKRVNAENWFLSEETVNLVLTEAQKITQYFRSSIPDWVNKAGTPKRYR